jgi:uncharacterized circularly permuted ATP-grasp superfamily protein/uncharacterized alpha-E superfamily protein
MGKKIFNASQLLENYARGNGHYDEMLEKPGSFHAHWSKLVYNLQKIGGKDLISRYWEAQRLLRENGVTYNVYNQPGGLNRPWQLDTVPFLVQQAEWAQLEKGIIQRAELMNLILEDLYGPRLLIRHGLLPQELIYQHSGFLRPCDQLLQPGRKQLLMYAADMARGPDGSFWVISDRAQAPSGTGYALENRSVMNRVLPDLFEGYQVRKISGFFEHLKSTLQQLSPQQRENPRIVILTPGPNNETYFEHAYLASYLGFTLVQGGDLVVRDGYVWLKSIRGLERVDIIVRRVDGSYCDPLELNANSQLGVAGLLEVIRRKNVLMVNPIGSSVVENPGINAFLGNICQFFLKEDLLIPSIASWWCGHEHERKYVLENLDRLIIKVTDRQYAHKTFFGSLLSKSELQQLKDAILAKPYLYVGQEQVHFSTAPSLVEEELAPRYSVLRTFLIAHGQSYTMMPGGLTRSAPDADTFFVSNQTGGISKDTWVLAPDALPSPETLPQSNYPTTIKPHIGFLPSRTAENLYWVARYSVRTLETARLLRLILQKISNRHELMQGFEKEVLKNLLFSLTHLTYTYPGFIGENKEHLLEKPEEEIFSVILNGSRTGSLTHCIATFINSSFAVREQLSLDTWRIFDSISKQWLADTPPPRDVRVLQTALDQLITSIVAFMGFTSEAMTREQGKIIYDIGRHLEHGLLMVSMLRATMVFKHSPTVEFHLLEDILTLSESLNTYRYRYRLYPQTKIVTDLLLLDTTNPRALAYHASRIQKLLADLPKNQTTHHLSEEQRLILDVFSKLRLCDAEKLTKSHAKSALRENMDNLLADIGEGLAACSNAIIRSYFDHTKTQRSLLNFTDNQPLL